MNEIGQTNPSTPTTEAKDNLLQAREAFKAEVTTRNQADAARLGHIAARHEVHADVHGNLLRPSEVQAIARGDTAYKE